MNETFSINPATTHKEMKEHIYQNLLIDMLKMDRHTSYRDNTIMLALCYENFNEFFDENKKLFIVKFSRTSLLFAAIIKMYFRVQMSCVLKGDENREGLAGVETLLVEIIGEHIDDLISIIKTKYPATHLQIEQLNEKGI